MKKFYLLLLMLIYSSMAWATGIDANPALNNDGSNDPHMSGVWLLMLDRNNNELWYEMSLANEYGDYSYILRTYCYIFGCKYYWDSQLCDYTPIDSHIPSRNYRGNEDIITYDARFCFVINGVRYGPEENYKEVVFGDALSNPLVESNNYFTMMTGIIVNMGVGFDDDGKAYAYAGHCNWGEIAYLSYKDNFPDPHNIGCWLLMLDRNNNEIWKEMMFDNGDYTCIIQPYCYIFGCTYWWHSYFCDYTPIDNNIPSAYFDQEHPDYSNPIVYNARLCIVIDGVRYGPEENYSETVLGDALANPLVETNNYYTTQTGRNSIIGVAFDDKRNAYLYHAIVSFGYDGGYLSYDKNFPIPQVITGDVNCDNEVNIADVNALCDMILSGNFSSIGDVNGDGEINIGDVNAIIDIIQGN